MFDPIKAREAQHEYCNRFEIPMMIPDDGICDCCGYNIFLPKTDGKNPSFGHSVEHAGRTLIITCPHCGNTLGGVYR